MPMTPRERWNAVLNRKEPDRVPTDYWATEEVTERLLKDLGCATEDDLWRALHIDRTHQICPPFIGPEELKENLWRVERTDQEYADGAGSYEEVIDGPFARMQDPGELEDFAWPSPDWFDYSVVPKRLDEWSEWPILAGHFEPFNLYCALRGLEQALMDTVAAPDFLEVALHKIFEFHYEFNTRVFEAAGKDGGILYTYVAEDLGSQNGLLMSLPTIERFLIPRMKAMIDLAHGYGIRAFHHDDGACRPVLPRMVEIGMDILNPIQWRCPGMEREGLKRDFGDALIFHGAVDNQQTLPFGTPKDVRQEVFDNIRILGAGGGHIVAPCHNLQPVTPTENILAMYAAVDEYCG